jgi:hypothetical protein
MPQLLLSPCLPRGRGEWECGTRRVHVWGPGAAGSCRTVARPSRCQASATPRGSADSWRVIFGVFLFRPLAPPFPPENIYLRRSRKQQQQQGPARLGHKFFRCKLCSATVHYRPVNLTNRTVAMYFLTVAMYLMYVYFMLHFLKGFQMILKHHAFSIYL